MYLIRSLAEDANGIPIFDVPILIATRLDTWSPLRPEQNVRIPGCFNAAPYTAGAVDPNPVDGTLFCVYHDTTAAPCAEGLPCQYDIDIFFTKSSSRGDPGTWTTPQRIVANDFAPYDQFFPWIEAVPGRLDLTFFDTRGALGHTDQDYPALLRTQYAWSTNGGTSWSEETIAPRFAGAPAVWRGTDCWYGEYIGMASS